jgi:hypothetical protein
LLCENVAPLRILKRNTSVNLATGERTDQLVGEGQTVDVPHWTEKQLAAFREFERAMREEVIPEIDRVMRMRAERAQESRQWIILSR